MSTLHWGILGTGAIARTFSEGLETSRTGRLVAVASRAQAKADAFVAANCSGRSVRSHGSYESLLADPNVHAVYISTPHPDHAQWAAKAAQAKKHVLCEKPLAVNHRQAAGIIDAARQNDVFLMEAFMYRCHPQTARVVELVRSKAIGDVKMIHAAFGFHAPFDPESRLYKNSLAGGGILDVGCYPVSMSRLIAGAATGKDFAEPIDVQGAGHLGQTGVDEYATATMRFPGDILATVATAVRLELENTVRISGTHGHIVVPTPWVPAREGGVSEIHVHRTGREREVVKIETTQHLYAIEADVVANSIGRRQAPSPAMSWDDSLGNMKTLDAWRKALNFTYEFEKR
jgi:predicted dehydrogenase